MTQERYRRMWYFKERRIPPLLPPHPSSLAAAVHDCLFSIFTVNPHFWGPFGYPQPADALGSCSSLLSASPLAATFPPISLGEISLSYIANTSRTHACTRARAQTLTLANTHTPPHGTPDRRCSLYRCAQSVRHGWAHRFRRWRDNGRSVIN